MENPSWKDKLLELKEEADKEKKNTNHNKNKSKEKKSHQLTHKGQ